MSSVKSIKINKGRRCVIFLLLLLLLTPARAISLFILPLVLLCLNINFPYKLKYKKSMYVLTGLFVASSLLGLAIDTTSFEGVLLSCIIFMPMFFLLFCEPICYVDKSELIDKIASPFLILLLMIDILGLFFWLNGGVDDYGVAYGQHYEFAHGLSMINTYVFFWYTMKFFYGHLSKKEFVIWGYISFSIFGCAYGLGYICLMLSFVLFLLAKARLKSLIILLFLFVVVYGAFQSSYFWYERHNISKALDNVDVRKITMFNDFFLLLKDDPRIFYIGTGPGGYNSRSTLLLSGDNQNFINKELGNIRPPYYKKYIYPLWNRTFVSQSDFTDGTRNKPFSSFVSIWAEQGFFFFLIFVVIYIRMIWDLRRYKNYKSHYNFLIILDLFMVISLISHLWFETTEFMVYCIIRFFFVMFLKGEKSVEDVNRSPKTWAINQLE